MTLIRFYNQSVKRDIAKEKQTWLVLYLYRKKVTFPFIINAWYKDILHSFENMTNMKRKMAKVTIIFLAIQSGRGVGNQRSPDSDEGDLTAAELKEL